VLSTIHEGAHLLFSILLRTDWISRSPTNSPAHKQSRIFDSIGIGEVRAVFRLIFDEQIMLSFSALEFISQAEGKGNASRFLYVNNTESIGLWENVSLSSQPDRQPKMKDAATPRLRMWARRRQPGRLFGFEVLVWV